MPAPNRITKAVAGLRSELEGLRADIASLRNEHDTLHGGRVSLDDALSLLHKAIDAKAAAWANRVDLEVLTVQAARPDDLDLLPHMGMGSTPADAAEALICHLAGDALKERLGERLKSMMADDAGPPREQRAARLRDITRKLDDLERTEERLIREAKRVGIELDRRPDARPEIVLAEDL